MNLFFEESGDFKAGTMLSQTPESYQVELASGKRCKVKARDVLLQFATPSPEVLLREAHAISDEIELDFLWEVAGEEEFGFAELGADYFGAVVLPAQAAGLIFRLHSAPIYFYKKGRGRYKAAPAASVQAALAGMEKKRLQALLQAEYVEQLKAGSLPPALTGMVQQLLFKPDKNTLEYKALITACSDLHTSPERLMLAAGGIASAKDLHFSRFINEFFPKGTGFAALEAPDLPKNLPVAEVAAFSIDDMTTTEIDDALSVVTRSDGMLQIGVHIAAPGLGITRGDGFDQIARSRMSTVYMPGDKITMLPDVLVNTYTLGAGQTRPAVSLYAIVNPEDWSLISTESRIEAVPISANLRNNDLDELITEETLAAGSGDYPHKNDIAILWQWAKVLEQGRMDKRAGFGLKPEQNNRVDFNFYVEDDVVSIIARKRGSPLDKIVAELMIFANSTWGKLMADHGIPGIYRSQGAGSGGWAARMQVRMLTHAAPHHSLGVDQYAWSTSPLRRYTDLVNQWQIMACINHGVTAPLVAPFKPRDADLFAIVSGFDAAYAGYNDFQSNMERYWCLRWFAQEWRQQRAKQVEAVVLKDEVLRLADIPLVIRLSGMPAMARGSRVKLDIIGWDEVDLTLEARFLELLSVPDAISVAEEGDAGSDNDAAEKMDESEVTEASGASDVMAPELVDTGTVSADAVPDPEVSPESAGNTDSLN